eukprot:m.162829 g.162829  ORF g.162829 m.162829 type:complete len:1586 (-) comp9872_c1_seq11:917-5674(-)
MAHTPHISKDVGLSDASRVNEACDIPSHPHETVSSEFTAEASAPTRFPCLSQEHSTQPGTQTLSLLDCTQGILGHELHSTRQILLQYAAPLSARLDVFTFGVILNEIADLCIRSASPFAAFTMHSWLERLEAQSRMTIISFLDNNPYLQLAPDNLRCAFTQPEHQHYWSAIALRNELIAVANDVITASASAPVDWDQCVFKCTDLLGAESLASRASQGVLHQLAILVRNVGALTSSSDVPLPLVDGLTEYHVRATHDVATSLLPRPDDPASTCFVRVLWALSQSRAHSLASFNAKAVLKLAGVAFSLHPLAFVTPYQGSSYSTQPTHTDEEQKANAPPPPGAESASGNGSAIAMEESSTTRATTTTLTPLPEVDPLSPPLIAVSPDEAVLLIAFRQSVSAYRFADVIRVDLPTTPFWVAEVGADITALTATSDPHTFVTGCRNGAIAAWQIPTDVPPGLEGAPIREKRALWSLTLSYAVVEIFLPNKDSNFIIASVVPLDTSPLSPQTSEVALIFPSMSPSVTVVKGTLCGGAFSGLSPDLDILCEFHDTDGVILVGRHSKGFSTPVSLPCGSNGIISVTASASYTVAVTDVHSIAIWPTETAQRIDIPCPVVYPYCICANCRLCPGNLSKFTTFRKERVPETDTEYKALDSLLGRVKGFQVTEAFKIHNGTRSLCFQHGLYSMSLPFSVPVAAPEESARQDELGAAKRVRTDDGNAAASATAALATAATPSTANPPAASEPAAASSATPAAPASAPARPAHETKPSDLLKLYLMWQSVPFMPRHLLPAPRLTNVPTVASPPSAAQVAMSTGQDILGKMLGTAGIDHDAFKKVNAQWLFHTPTGIVDQILQKSIDNRFSKIGSFGRGCYFTDSIEKASTYYRLDWGVQHDPQRADEKFVLVCLVALGRTRPFQPLDKDSSLYCEPRGYDSVVGFVQGWKEFVVYNPNRIFVSYLVYYRGSTVVATQQLPTAAPAVAPPPAMPAAAAAPAPAPTNVVYIPASLKTFFNELISRTTNDSPQKGAQAKLCISKLLRGQMPVREFLDEISKLLGSSPPAGLEQSITQRLQNISSTPTGPPMGAAAAAAAAAAASAAVASGSTTPGAAAVPTAAPGVASPAVPATPPATPGAIAPPPPAAPPGPVAPAPGPVPVHPTHVPPPHVHSQPLSIPFAAPLVGPAAAFAAPSYATSAAVSARPDTAAPAVSSIVAPAAAAGPAPMQVTPSGPSPTVSQVSSVISVISAPTSTAPSALQPSPSASVQPAASLGQQQLPPAAPAGPTDPSAAGASAPAGSAAASGGPATASASASGGPGGAAGPLRVSKVYIQSSLRDFFEELIKRAEAKSPASAHLVKVRITALLTGAIDAKLFLSDMSYVLGVPSPEGLEQNLRQQLDKVRFPTQAEQEADQAAAAAGVPPPANTLSLALTPLPSGAPAGPGVAGAATPAAASAGRATWGSSSAPVRIRLPRVEETTSQDVEGLKPSTEIPSSSQPVLVSGDQVIPLTLARYFRALLRIAVDVHAHRTLSYAISNYLVDRVTDTFIAKTCEVLNADPPTGLDSDLQSLIAAASVIKPRGGAHSGVHALRGEATA